MSGKQWNQMLRGIVVSPSLEQPIWLPQLKENIDQTKIKDRVVIKGPSVKFQNESLQSILKDPSGKSPILTPPQACGLKDSVCYWRWWSPLNRYTGHGPWWSLQHPSDSIEDKKAKFQTLVQPLWRPKAEKRGAASCQDINKLIHMQVVLV